MANTQTTTAEPAPSWLWAVLIVLAILPIVFWMTRQDDSTPETAEMPARSCEIWSEQYAVIPWNRFPNDTLRVGRGEQWVVQLHPVEMSGVIILDPWARDNWTLPTDETHMLFSDGLEITDAPGKSVERGRRNTFRAWGEGCLLVRVSG